MSGKVAFEIKGGKATEASNVARVRDPDIARTKKMINGCSKKARERGQFKRALHHRWDHVAPVSVPYAPLCILSSLNDAIVPVAVIYRHFSPPTQ